MLEPGSLLAFLAEVLDPRDRPGRRHALIAMFAHACCAILCGCRGYAAIVQWGRDQPIELIHKLGYRRRHPAYGTFQGLFDRLDAWAFEAAVAGWVGRLLTAAGADGLRVVTIDDKSARQSHGRRPGRPPPGGAGPADRLRPGPGARPGRDQRAQGGPGPPEGDGAPGAGHHRRAAFCRRDLCRQVVGDDGHYLLKVDDNQPTLKADIETALSPHAPGIAAASRTSRRRWTSTAGGSSSGGWPRRRCSTATSAGRAWRGSGGWSGR